ncbi:phosphatidate cytidylyltransferase [Oryzifoliimicrobium ureilyticus]|uniref:phosphatidate cytidylyltransferase n=1 Tax=Oryzifoliimicrobium ureilyticus TaxID=3113724 RepID=UPI0030768151
MQEELKLRIISGIVLAVVVLSATWLGGIPFRLLSALIALLIYYEWTSITGADDHSPMMRMAGWAGQILVAVAVIVGSPTVAFILLILLVLFAIFVTRSGETNWWLPGGMVYAGLTVIALAAIRGSDAEGLRAMLFLFAVVWATDIMAYFIGRAIGGPKLAPKISPGKTWSGAIGGAFSAVVVASIVVWLSAGSVATGALIALVLSIFSQAGDLFESFIKRRYGVKDSSHLIPGHGGVMDRVDGLIFACCGAFLLAGLISLISGGTTSALGAVLLGL